MLAWLKGLWSAFRASSFAKWLAIAAAAFLAVLIAIGRVLGNAERRGKEREQAAQDRRTLEDLARVGEAQREAEKVSTTEKRQRWKERQR